jgi:hypothetical protein
MIIVCFVLNQYIGAIILFSITSAIFIYWYWLLKKELIIYEIHQNGGMISYKVLKSEYKESIDRIVNNLINEKIVTKEGDVIKLIEYNYRFSFIKHKISKP